MTKHMQKHRRKVYSEEKTSSRRCRICSFLAVVYLFVVIAATVYSQATHIERLPTVVLTHSEAGQIPLAALHGDKETGYWVYTVQQSDGPWGKQYRIHETHIMTPLTASENGSDMIFARELRNTSDPVVVECSIQDIADGMEVRLTK